MEIRPLTKRAARDLETQKRQLLRELRAVERFYAKHTGYRDEAQDLGALKQNIAAFKPADTSGYNALGALQNDFQNLRKAYDEARVRAERLKAFEQNLQVIESRIKQVKRSRLAIDSSFQDSVVQLKNQLRKIKTEKDPDVAEQLFDDILDTADTVNEYLPRLELLARIPDAVRIVGRQVAEAERITRNAIAIARKIKIDVGAQTNEMQSLLAAMQEAHAAIKTGSPETNDLMAFIEENSSLRLDQIRTLGEQMQAMVNIKKYVAGTSSSMKQFAARIAQRERNGDDVAVAQGLLDQLTQYREDLRPLAAHPLSQDEAEGAVNLLRGIAETSNELERELRLISPDALQQQLEKLFQNGATILKKFEVPTLAR